LIRLRALALAFALLLAAPAAAPALEAPNPGARGSLAFASSRCEQGGVSDGAPDPYNPPPGGRCNAGIFRVRADGSGITRLTGTDPAYRDMLPVWSSDGKQIAFIRSPVENTMRNGRVMAMNADGTDVHDLLPDAPGTSDVNAVAWSPAGDKIAFMSDYLPLTLAWADVATGEIHPIPRHGLGIGGPIVFSPDGTKIALMGRHVDPAHPDDYDVDTSDGGVWITDLSGDHQERLTTGGVHMSGDGFAISPDWRYLAFTLWDPSTTDIGDMWTIKLDGTELTKRTDVTFADEPVISPFGPTLFFTNKERRWSNIKRVDLARGGPSQAVTNPPQGTGDGMPAWGPFDVDAPKPPTDDDSPAVLLGSDLGVTPSAGTPASARAKSSTAAPGDRLPFLALDGSGVKRVDVALAKRVKGKRCRFLHDENLGHTTRCGKPHYFGYVNPKVWKRHLRKLAAGRYVIRFRTTDAKGHRTKHPKPRTVRLR
jgi:Tol biopolymer transport system component